MKTARSSCHAHQEGLPSLLYLFSVMSCKLQKQQPLFSTCCQESLCSRIWGLGENISSQAHAKLHRHSSRWNDSVIPMLTLAWTVQKPRIGTTAATSGAMATDVAATFTKKAHQGREVTGHASFSELTRRLGS